MNAFALVLLVVASANAGSPLRSFLQLWRCRCCSATIGCPTNCPHRCRSTTIDCSTRCPHCCRSTPIDCPTRCPRPSRPTNCPHVQVAQPVSALSKSPNQLSALSKSLNPLSTLLNQLSAPLSLNHNWLLPHSLTRLLPTVDSSTKSTLL
ncbi:hypothetical protein Ocin01_17547 [Orchesella cincta]|uniref:Uncharacterized protein n=1 Tax=Orchesella cincta TaxID=48709 RepID=A0A1D2M828_ORCCI|nr:hypothetical protein Ocin01_17547 [Orchesella cincta]